MQTYRVCDRSYTIVNKTIKRIPLYQNKDVQELVLEEQIQQCESNVTCPHGWWGSFHSIQQA
jgi:hypothetical protein